MTTSQDINFTPPQGVRDAARRGLDMYEDGKGGDGLEQGTIRVARNLASGKAVSPEQARKGNRFWARNERFLSEPKDSAAYVSALLWGGRPGMSWYRKLSRQLEAKEKKGNVELQPGRQYRAHITRRVNKSMISERKNPKTGNPEFVVRSVVAKDDSVLNGILYPKAELDLAMNTLEGIPAPFGHPKDKDGDFLPALDAAALNAFGFGAYNENPRREGDRIVVDKIIDIAKANESEMGQRVLEALKNGDPIHTSTGLLCHVSEGGRDDACRDVATDILFDHDAILLDEEGAATPEQGIGMLVNKALDKEGNRIGVFNSFDDLDEVLTEPQKVSLSHLFATAIKDFFVPERKPETNSNEVDMSDKDETKVDDVPAEDPKAVVNEMTQETVNGMVEKAMKKMMPDMMNEYMEKNMPDMMNRMMKDKEKAANADKHASLVEQVVAQNMLNEDTAKETPLAALEAMVANSGFAAPIHGNFKVNSKVDDFDDLPED